MVVDVPRIDGDVDVVVLLLQRGEGGHDLALLIGEQVGFRWRKLDLILVFLWHLPLVLQGNSGFVLDLQLLLAGDPLVDWREEQLLVVAQLQGRLVAVSYQVDLLDVRGVVVVDALCLEVELSRLPGVELEADDAEALAVDEADGGEGFESLGGILEDLVVDGGVAGVRDLDRLVDGLVGPAAGESHIVLRAQLHHWDEGLGPWRERVAHEANIHADWGVDVLVDGILVL